MRTGNVTFDGKWIELPVLSTTERDVIPSPQIGYEIYNSTTLQIESFDGSVWKASSGGGATGPAGPAGYTGTQGETGLPGPGGLTGSPGVQGSTGAQGTHGDTGVQGVTGTQGVTGANGVTGYQGLTGLQGVQGPTGLQGTQGLTGITYGATGFQGLTGAQGQTGPVGAGVPTGGTAGQVLAKIDATDYNTQWVSESTVEKSTGLISGGILSIGSPNTAFSISDGSGVVVDNSTIPATVTNVSWTGKTNIPATYVTTYLVSYIGIDATGTVFQSNAPLTNIQRRSYISLGSLIHVNKLNLDNVNNFAEIAIAPLNQLTDLSESLGKFNVSGNIFSASSNNLKLAKSLGYLHAHGTNWSTSKFNPNVITLPGLTNLTFQYRLQDGSNYSTGTDIIPGRYDTGGGTTAAVAGNRYSIQRIYSFVSNNVKVQFGQATYSTMAAAKAAIQTDLFVTEPSIVQNGVLRAFLIVKGDTTDLSLTTSAFFYEAGVFGGQIGVGGQSVSSLQNAYDNSSDPEIVTSVALGPVTYKVGTGVDTDAVIETWDTAGIVTSHVHGDGSADFSRVGTPGAFMDSAGATGTVNQMLVKQANGTQLWTTTGSGATGVQGFTGIQGVTGLIGQTGSQGITGASGQTGYQGNTGTQGVQGVTGLIGATGLQGLTGVQGATGLAGTTGVQGAQGVTGIQGLTGLIGTTGVQGAQGATGVPGATGLSGVTGLIGVTGIQGLTGPQGHTGPVGTTDLQQAYNIGTANPEILTNATKGAVSIRRGSTSDSDVVLEVQNGGGTGTFSVDGLGHTVVNDLYSTYITFAAQSGFTGTARQLFFDAGSNSLAYKPVTPLNDVTANICREEHIEIYNNTGVAIANGQACHISGSFVYGGRRYATTVLASSAVGSTVYQASGIATHDIPAGAVGLISWFGEVRDLNLSYFSNGDEVYLSNTVPGGFCKIGDLGLLDRSSRMGWVVDNSSTSGVLLVLINNEGTGNLLPQQLTNILTANNSSTGIFRWDSPCATIADATHFDIREVQGWIIDATTTPLAPIVTYVTYPGATGVLDTKIASGSNTHLLLDTSGSLVQQSAVPTPQQRRDNIYLGHTVHPGLTGIQNIVISPDIDIAPLSQVRDMWSAIKFINEGVAVYPRDADMTISLTGGFLFGSGINWAVDHKNPAKAQILAQTLLSFQYRTQTNSARATTTLIDPTVWDVGGVFTTLPAGNNTATNQRVYIAPSGLVRIQPGQAWYNNLAAAIAAIQTEQFVTALTISENLQLIGIISVRQGATNLSLTGQDATFIPVSKFGENLGGAAGMSTATLQQAYNNSVTPEIVTNALLGALSVRRGSTSDTDNVIEVLNGLSTVTSSIRGDGYAHFTTLGVTGALLDSSGATGTANQILVKLANGGQSWASGVAGITGYQGITGTQGTQGNTGLGGITGIQGTQGITGAQGVQGITGSSGVQGITGLIGVQGVTGTQGVQGITGISGVQGITGSNGTQGSQGLTGAQGAQGITGNQGTQGITGSNGIQGIQGITGAVGTQGTQGITGAQGTQGITGVNGVQGITGSNGIQGITGLQGVQGITGVNGVQGITGVVGLTGTWGITGRQGTTGTQGIQGITGTQGTQGNTGFQGITGITYGATGLQGIQGFTGVRGATGLGNYSYTNTFTNASLSSGILTVTHGLGTKNCVVSVKDNNDKDLTPDDITSSATTVVVDLTSYGTLTGTWSITIVASGGVIATQTLQQVYNNSLTSPQVQLTAPLGPVVLKSVSGGDTGVAFAIQYGATGTNSLAVLGSGTIVMPKATNTGIMLDPATPTWGWRDLIGAIRPDPAGAGAPVLTVFRAGSVRMYAYTTADKMDCEFHIPHDYVPGTDMFVHVHWSHNGTAISGNFVGTCAYTYAKGHNQAIFPAEKTVTITYATVNLTTTPQYIHRVDEVAISSAGGSATLLDSALIEVDGMLLLNLTMTTIPTITGGSARVFISHIDLHYQSNNMTTKNKAPNFYT